MTIPTFKTTKSGASFVWDDKRYVTFFSDLPGKCEWISIGCMKPNVFLPKTFKISSITPQPDIVKHFGKGFFTKLKKALKKHGETDFVSTSPTVLSQVYEDVFGSENVEEKPENTKKETPKTSKKEEKKDITSLTPDTTYGNGVKVKLKTKNGSFEVTRTTAKRVYYLDGDKERFAALTSVKEVL